MCLSDGSAHCQVRRSFVGNVRRTSPDGPTRVAWDRRGDPGRRPARHRPRVPAQVGPPGRGRRRVNRRPCRASSIAPKVCAEVRERRGGAPDAGDARLQALRHRDKRGPGRCCGLFACGATPAVYSPAVLRLRGQARASEERIGRTRGPVAPGHERLELRPPVDLLGADAEMDGSEVDVFGPNSAGVGVPGAVLSVTTRVKPLSTAKANRSTPLPSAGGDDARPMYWPPRTASSHWRDRPARRQGGAASRSPQCLRRVPSRSGFSS